MFCYIKYTANPTVKSEAENIKEEENIKNQLKFSNQKSIEI